MKKKSYRQLHVIFCSRAYFCSKHFALPVIWWCHIMRPSDFPLKVVFFQINLLSSLDILSLVLGDWFCSGNIKHVFFMVPPKLCCTKSAVNKWAYISETPSNQPDYPWFLKCILILGLEKPILINSHNMSHLPPSATGLFGLSISRSFCFRSIYLSKGQF